MAEIFKVSIVLKDSYDVEHYEDILMFTENEQEAGIIIDALKRVGSEMLTMIRRKENIQ